MARKSFFHYFDIVDRDDSGLIEQNEVECKFNKFFISVLRSS